MKCDKTYNIVERITLAPVPTTKRIEAINRIRSKIVLASKRKKTENNMLNVSNYPCDNLSRWQMMTILIM